MDNEVKLSAYCFEDESVLPFYRALLPEKRDYLFSLNDFVTVVTGTSGSSRDQRWAAFLELLPPELQSQASSLMVTIEELRHARVLNEEDWDLLLAEIPDSPKISALRRALKIYLQSDLIYDTAGRITLAIERLNELYNENADFSLPFSTEFVPALFPSPLFLECAQYFEKRGLGSLWQAPKLPMPTQGISRATLGDPFETGKQMAAYFRRQSRWTSRSSGVTLFDGSAANRRLFRLALKSQKIPFVDWFTEPTAVRSPREKWYSHIRRSEKVPTQQRLKWANDLLLIAQGKSEADWQRELPEMALAETVLAPSAVLADVLATASAVEPKTAIVPFHLGPWQQTKPIGAVAFWSGESANLLFREGLFSNDERERLVSRGYPIFSLSRQLAHIRSQFLTLGALGIRRYGLPAQAALFQRILIRQRKPKLKIKTTGPEGGSATSSEKSFVVPARPLSATHLEAYAACPAKYFYGQVLRLRAHAEMHEEDSALMFGQAAHEALEKFFTAGRVPVDAGALEALFEAALVPFTAALEKIPALRITLVRRFRDMCQKVASLESALEDLIGPSIPTYLELPFEFPVEGVLIRGKIDRVDRTPDGRLLILDYKTGTVDFTPEHVRRGENFQAFFYLQALMRHQANRFNLRVNLGASPEVGSGIGPIIGMLFYDLKKGELRRGILIDEEIAPAKKKLVTRGHVLSQTAFQSLMDDAHVTLKGILSRIREGNYTPTPSPENCGFCDYAAFCREAYHYA